MPSDNDDRMLPFIIAFRLRGEMRRGGADRLRIGDASVAFRADASTYAAAVAEQCARAAPPPG